MLHKIVKYLAFICICSLFVTGCKKKSTSTGNKTKTDLLTQKTWYLSKFEKNLNNGPWADDLPNWQSCIRDDGFVFKANLQYEANEGPTKCNPGDPQVYYYNTWQWQDNETRLDVGGLVMDLLQLDESTLVLQYSSVNGGDTEYIKESYRH